MYCKSLSVYMARPSSEPNTDELNLYWGGSKCWVVPLPSPYVQEFPPAHSIGRLLQSG